MSCVCFKSFCKSLWISGKTSEIYVTTSKGFTFIKTSEIYVTTSKGFTFIKTSEIYVATSKGFTFIKSKRYEKIEPLTNGLTFNGLTV